MSKIQSLDRKTDICLRNSLDVKRFSHYASNMNVIFVDVERDREKSVFNALINAFARQEYLSETISG